MQTIGSPEDPDSLVGRVLPRGLQIVERLGATIEGPLYRGQYSEPGPPVAVTVLRPPSNVAGRPASPPLSDRHWQQLRRACRIQHPNVATLLDVGETPDGLVYAVGELLTGELVSDIVAVSGALPPGPAVDICLQVAEGLRAAHAAGVVHGSVSSQAVLVTGGGDRLTVKLVRFDFARPEGDRADQRAATATAWGDGAPDPTDDIVGLGVLLHCLLTGGPPDSERRPHGVPPALRRVIDRALGARGRPYPTVAALADDLARMAGAGSRRPRRSRLRLAAIAAAAALLAGGLWFGWTRMREAVVEARNEVGIGAPETVADSQPAGREIGRPPGATPDQEGNRSTGAGRRIDSSGARAAPVQAPSRDPAALSPFRRSHPWAAEPLGRVYFSSSCPAALRATDLVYFRTEAEARATGRTRSPDRTCP